MATGHREISKRDREGISALIERIETVREGAPSNVGEFLPELAALMRTDSAGAYSLSAGLGETVALDFVRVLGGSEQTEDVAAQWFGALPERSLHFNPLQPDVSQRNAVLTMSDLEHLTGIPRDQVAMTELARTCGFWRGDQIRVLLCDGPVLLAWFGAFRDEPFGARERAILNRLRRPLLARARTDRILSQNALHRSLLDTALEAFGVPAFLTTSAGAIVHANTAGRRLLDQDLRSTKQDIAMSLLGRSHTCEVIRVAASGLSPHALVVRRTVDVDPLERRPDLVERWRLTIRQREVLRLLVRGCPNKTIAATLGCSPRTVEVHVAAVLAKAGAESRAELVARFWTS